MSRACCILPFLTAGLLTFGSSALAQLNITLEYNDTKHAPTWDPDGACLTRIMEAAAEHWESIYTSGTKHNDVSIAYRWYDYYAVSIGLAEDPGPNTWANTRRKVGALSPNSYVLKFWTATSSAVTPWFIDDSPEDHSEFEMKPRLYLDPSDPSAGIGLDGYSSGAFEVGFQGSGRVNDALIPGCGIATAAAGIDLYSVVLHEMGHALGLGFRNESDAKADGDYDISSVLPGGGIGVVAALDSDGKLDAAHIQAPYALMTPGISTGVRRLPSIADILAIASINGWTSVSLPRTFWSEAGKTEQWHKATMWLDDVPTTSQSAVLCFGAPDVDLRASATADGVFLDDVTQLVTGGYTLQAGQSLSLLDDGCELTADGGAVQAELVFHHGKTIAINGGGSLIVASAMEADGNAVVNLFGTPGSPALYVSPSGVIRLSSASVLNVFNALVQASMVDLRGTAAQVLGGGAGMGSRFEGLNQLVNDGLIATANGDLRFTPAVPSVFFDLDGDEAVDVGRIDAIDGSVVFAAPTLDPFGGRMRIGATRSISVSSNLSINAGGSIEFIGTDSHLHAGHIDVLDGKILVSGSSEAFIHAQQSWWPDGGASIDAVNGLYLLSNSDYRGGMALTGGGFAVQIGDAIVYPDPGGLPSTIDVANYLWDGEWSGSAPGVYSETIVLDQASLVITGAVGTSSADGYDGTVYVKEDAELQVDRDWILEGELVLEGGTIRSAGTITNRGTIRGYGSIETEVVNEGVIQCEGAGIKWCATCYVPAGGTCTAGCCVP